MLSSDTGAALVISSMAVGNPAEMEAFDGNNICEWLIEVDCP
jgi:hypothetical protein